jgi:hypothetical protein
MTITFEDAAPVKSSAPGRPARPNPFTEVIAAIALKTDTEGKPLAKSYIEKHTAGEREKVVKRVKRELSAAGHANNTAVTVCSSAEPVKTGAKGKEVDSETDTRITFWTTKLQVRPRKPKTDAVERSI